MYQENNTGSHQDTGYSMGQTMNYDAMELPKKNKRIGLPMIICIVLALILLLEVVFFFARIHAIKENRTRYIPDAPVTMTTMDEAFHVGPNQRKITIKEVEDIGWQEGLAKGYKMVRVNCLLGYQNEISIGWMGQMFLQSNGVYYPCLSRYQLEETNPQLMVHALDTYNLLNASTNEGWIYFILPQDAADGTVWINVIEEDDDYEPIRVESIGMPVAFEKGESDNA